MEAAAALVDRLAHRTLAEVLFEQASWSGFLDSLSIRLEARQARLRAWSSGRRAAALLADERILKATLRPYLAGSVEIPEWIEPELGVAMCHQFNMLSRCPVLAVPSGVAENGVPTGVQLVGRSYEDETVFRAGAALEAARPRFRDAASRPAL